MSHQRILNRRSEVAVQPKQRPESVNSNGRQPAVEEGGKLCNGLLRDVVSLVDNPHAPTEHLLGQLCHGHAACLALAPKTGAAEREATLGRGQRHSGQGLPAVHWWTARRVNWRREER